MRKAYVSVIILALLLSACSINKSENNYKSELTTTQETAVKETSLSEVMTYIETTLISETTTAPIQTTQTLPQTETSKKEIKGDLTIRNATKLDTAEIDDIGPLIDGKLITFRNTGKAYLTVPKTDFDKTEEISYYEKEVGYIDCKTGEKVVLCTVKPINDISTAIGYDSTYIYAAYIKYPDEVVPTTMTEPEYYNKLHNLPLTVIRIKIKTKEINEYTVNFTRGLCLRYCEIIPVGAESLLIHSNSANESSSQYYFESMEILDLGSGKTNTLYSYDIVSGMPPIGIEKMDYCSSGSDSVLFMTSEKIGDEWKFGFKVYNSKMELIDSQTVYQSKDLYMGAAFLYQGDIYYQIYDDMMGNMDPNIQTEGKYFKFTPNENKYISVPYNFKTNPFYIGGYGRQNEMSGIPYDIFQTTHDGIVSTVSLRNTFEPYAHELKLEILGYKVPPISTFTYLVNDLRSDYVILSGDNEKSGFGYYYISKEEIISAFYGG